MSAVEMQQIEREIHQLAGVSCPCKPVNVVVPSGLLGLAISVSIGTFRLYRAAAVLRMLVVAFRLWLSGFQPVSREGGCGLGAPRGRAALSCERPPAVRRRHAAAFRLRKGKSTE